jgi:hypothetical protein
MILVRTGGGLGLVVTLMVAALLVLVVRPAIDRTTERAFDGADRMLDEIGADPLSPASFAAVVTEIEQELGPRAELLGITVTGQGGNVKYRTGDSAAGYQWGPGREGLEPVNVTLVGHGRLGDNVFPIAKLERRAGAKLMAAVHARTSPGFDLRSMTLTIDPATGNPRWTVTGVDGGRARSFTARSDGSALRGAG